MLAQCGITTIAELEAAGAIRAYARVAAAQGGRASLNLLWAMAAGLEDRDWRSLTAEEKSLLLEGLAVLRR
jgi:hypothetical protein